MKVLLLSTDSQIFNEASQVRARILEYGKLFEELCVLVYTRPGKTEEKIGNVLLVPTNNRFRIGYFARGIRLGRRIMGDGAGWVVSSQDPFETALIGRNLKKRFHVPLQIQIHTDFLSPYFSRESFKNRIRVFLAKRIIRKADCIRVVSERIKKSLVALDGGLEEKIVVLPIFVDKDVFGIERRDGLAETFTVLTVARRAPEKNLSLADGIIKELKNKGHKVEWLLISDKSAAPYYKTANLFLLTSNYEGYGMAAVEAAAAGVPVVMTDVGVALGATFPVGDKGKAVEIIEDLIKNPDKRKRLVEQQNEFFRNWPTKEQYLEKFKKSLTF